MKKLLVLICSGLAIAVAAGFDERFNLSVKNGFQWKRYAGAVVGDCTPLEVVGSNGFRGDISKNGSSHWLPTPIWASIFSHHQSYTSKQNEQAIDPCMRWKNRDHNHPERNPQIHRRDVHVSNSTALRTGRYPSTQTQNEVSYG